VSKSTVASRSSGKISTRSVISITGWLHTVASLFAAERAGVAGSGGRAARPRSASLAPLAIDLLAARMSEAMRHGSG
jgi:hypothetical protein